MSVGFVLAANPETRRQAAEHLRIAARTIPAAADLLRQLAQLATIP
jgi:hypothetical protein